jgi:hypothetical protein
VVFPAPAPVVFPVTAPVVVPLPAPVAPSLAPAEAPSPTPAEEPEAETAEAPATEQASPAEEAPAPAAEAPLHDVRHLVIANRTGQHLKVFVKIDEARCYRWDFAPDQVACLAVGGEPLTLSQVFLWAESDASRWDEYRDRPLVLVPAPYRAEAVRSFTFTFNS